MPNALQISDPNADSDNPLLRGTPTAADAYDFNASALGQWIAAQRAKSSQMGLWNDQTGLPTAKGIVSAGQQYGNALLMGTTAPGVRFKPGLVDVGDVTAHINPSKNDIARMMQTAPEHRLRGFYEAPNHAVWPAYDATHAEMAEPLGFTENADNRQYYGRVGPPDDDYPEQAGRFSFYATADPKPRAE